MAENNEIREKSVVSGRTFGVLVLLLVSSVTLAVGGIGTGQLRATASGVKQWQVKGGADARLTFTGADQRAWT